ncbi:MAG: NupC/NupG family nucleoside CNT transporter [Chitinophagales bacterium]|nr:NupC/NupG family nucleoside CNT transporter [Chitinophagales bacterium]MDW8418718.1 nucleoside transporter C-terminal domain-containing protein [Chitinophagales bacterium]
MERLTGIFGMLFIIFLAWLLSNNKRNVNWRLVGVGLTLQLLFAILILKGNELAAVFAPLGWPKVFFNFVSRAFVKVLSFTTQGATFVFGKLAVSPGVQDSLGFFFAFQVLPSIIFFSSVMSVLYYLGIMQKIVQGMAWVMYKLMRTSGAESLSCTANIFVGQTEAPLMIKPFVSTMTQSELLAIMTGGMATIAGGVMAAYIQMLGNAYAASHGIPLQLAQVQFAEQLLGASFMAAPAALVIAKIIYPETETPVTRHGVKVEVEQTSSNLIEAAADGASGGLQLALNVGAMLLAFIALIALANWGLGKVGELGTINEWCMQHFGQKLSLQLLFGIVLQYVALAIGVPPSEAFHFGSLLGTKVVLNEFVAYSELSSLISNKSIALNKTVFMSTFALCGFANLSSIAIQIGGLSPLAPERRGDLARLGLRAVAGGTLANLMTATIAGILL